MKSHELARLLLTLPDIPVATHAGSHVYMSGISCSPLKIGRLHTYGGDHIVLGNISKRNLNSPNWFITDMLHGDAPEEWHQ